MVSALKGSQLARKCRNPDMDPPLRWSALFHVFVRGLHEVLADGKTLFCYGRGVPREQEGVWLKVIFLRVTTPM